MDTIELRRDMRRSLRAGPRGFRRAPNVGCGSVRRRALRFALHVWVHRVAAGGLPGSAGAYRLAVSNAASAAAIYAESAAVYDAVYAAIGKDYAAEAERLHRMLQSSAPIP